MRKNAFVKRLGKYFNDNIIGKRIIDKILATTKKQE